MSHIDYLLLSSFSLSKWNINVIFSTLPSNEWIRNTGTVSISLNLSKYRNIHSSVNNKLVRTASDVLPIQYEDSILLSMLNRDFLTVLSFIHREFLYIFKKHICTYNTLVFTTGRTNITFVERSIYILSVLGGLTTCLVRVQQAEDKMLQKKAWDVAFLT